MRDGLFQRQEVFLKAFLEISLAQDDDNVFRQIVELEKVDLGPDLSLDARSQDGVPKLGRDRKADAHISLLVLLVEDGHVVLAKQALPAIQNGLEVSRFPQSVAFDHRKSLGLGKTDSALGSPTIEDLASSLGGHSGTESASVSSLDFARLISTLHDDVILRFWQCA